jgi:hypothetical protein
MPERHAYHAPDKEVQGRFSPDGHGDYTTGPSAIRDAAAEANKPGKTGLPAGEFAKQAKAQIEARNKELVDKGLVPSLTIDHGQAGGQKAAEGKGNTDNSGAKVNHTSESSGRSEVAPMDQQLPGEHTGSYGDKPAAPAAEKSTPTTTDKPVPKNGGNTANFENYTSEFVGTGQ